MVTTSEQVRQLMGWRGHDLVDAEGSKIGTIADIYLDDDTGQPEWLAVTTGLFGTKVSFVPLAGASAQDNTLMVRWTKSQVKDAPKAEADGQLSEEEEAALYQHYGLGYGDSRSDSGLPEDRSGDRTAETAPRERMDSTPEREGRDVSGPTTDTAMTRSEEELQVGVQRREAGRARLRKWVDHETVTESVPTTRERVRVEREPMTDANRDAAMAGPALSEEEHEMPLYEDTVSAEKVVVPKERVRMDKDVVTDQREITEDLRRERIELDDGGMAGSEADDDRRSDDVDGDRRF